MRHPYWRGLAGAALWLAGAGSALAGYQGTFADDKDLAFFKVVADGTSPITIQSFGYDGGVMSGPITVSGGGFDPMLTLYDSSGNRLASPNPTDACTTDCLNDDGPNGRDSYYQDTLAGGTYWLVLGLSYNFGADYLGNGFGWDSLPSATPSAATNLCSPTGAFMDYDCNERTGDWALDILGFTSVEVKTLADARAEFPLIPPPSPPSLPEPGTLALLGLGLVGALRKRTA